MPTISVIIITYNEADKIESCLQSVEWADEIIVVDSGSSDPTTEICRKYTSNIYTTDWPGFGPQKNRALSYATGDWVLSIDADEQISSELQLEIQQTIHNSHADIYQIPRLSSFCGRYLHHGGWWPDYVTRLFKRGAGEFSTDIVHERLLHTNKAGKLKNPIKHDSIDNLDSMLSKINNYSSAGALKIVEKEKSSGLGTALLHGFWIFFRTYLLRLGFLDGKEGFIMAISAGENTYYRYLKAYYLTHRQ